jgi:hypothetical protein
LVKAGQWVAEQFAAITKAKARRDPDYKASTRNQAFADELERILVCGLQPRPDLFGMLHSRSG